ncbi:hypothetical protein F5X68DRAFT_204368 [Plectosphaerella plurivora]|uniref:Uncharacterized protein n=1 Tax=Plectosphaerella plurivora TaxID=936078 RepID=A0A9P9AC49_9PEZI|nr:hypothetical protein F5X68DRAFT_204368 [Plectosphaerella plurivora]
MDDVVSVKALLLREMAPTRLSRLYSLLFLASNQSNISPLHHQGIKGRTICVTERPDLHLVWHYNRIFVKPIPAILYLGPQVLVDYIKDTRDEDGNSLSMDIAGFMRSYSRLLEHESDFRIAQKLNLLPSWINWQTWCHTVLPYMHLLDHQVGRRYHYGEIRLTRLNFWHTVLRGCSYAQVHHNYATFLGRFGPPYLFIFGAVTVILTALQVGIDTFPNGSRYHDMAATFVPFSLILTVMGLAFLPTLILFFGAKELYFYFFKHNTLS